MSNVIKTSAEPRKLSRCSPKGVESKQITKASMTAPASVRIIIVEHGMKYSKVIRRAILGGDWAVEFYMFEHSTNITALRTCGNPTLR
jgi:hypothetical protein